jgi:hypothetical protein
MVLQWDAEDGGASDYADLPWSAQNAETGILSVNDRTSRTSSRIEITFGTHLVIDYGAIFLGYMKYRPKFAAVMRPAHEGMPEMPADPDYKRGVRFQLLIEGIGQTFFSTNSVFNDNQLGRYLSLCTVACRRRWRDSCLSTAFARVMRPPGATASSTRSRLSLRAGWIAIRTSSALVLCHLREGGVRRPYWCLQRRPRCQLATIGRQHRYPLIRPRPSMAEYPWQFLRQQSR